MIDVSAARRAREDDHSPGRPTAPLELRRDPCVRRRGINSTGYTAALIVSDYVVAWSSLVVGLLLLGTFSRNKVNHLSHLAVNVQHGFWFPIGIVIGFALTGGYRLSRRSPTQSTFSELKEYAMSCSFGAFIALATSYVAHHFGQWSIQVPTQVILAIIVSSLFIAISRATLRHVVLARRPQRVAVLDDGTTYGRIATHLHLEHGVDLVGRIDPGGHPDGAIGAIESIDTLVAEHQLDRVVFGSLNPATPISEAAYRRTAEIVDTALVPRLFEVISWRSRLTELSGLPLLELAPRHVSAYDRAMKRLFDLIVSTVALVLTAPICLVISLLVKVTSHGPIFFRQERLGRNRQPFTILKFRTMRESVNEDYAVPNEPVVTAGGTREPLYLARNKPAQTARLTPIGAFLRRTGLDEIPQFLNVLVGSMSVVGPRPFVTAESDQHTAWSERRFEVAPGITGLWQVTGRNNLTEDELRQLDYLYVSAWSMWWDIKICFDTPRAMIRGLGAY